MLSVLELRLCLYSMFIFRLNVSGVEIVMDFHKVHVCVGVCGLLQAHTCMHAYINVQYSSLCLHMHASTHICVLGGVWIGQDVF